MKLTDLPAPVLKYWQSLSLQEQQEVLACLGQNRKPCVYVLKVPATINQTGKALAYLTKHGIKYEAKRVGEKIWFTFNQHEVRNEVLIGMNTI